MTNNIFTTKEMETIFEIGRTIQAAVTAGYINFTTDKEAFTFALQIAVEFEKQYKETGNYYVDIGNFVKNKMIEMYSTEE